MFIADAFNKGNKKEIIPTGRLGFRPPTAKDWFNGTNIPKGFVETDDPKPGDIAASEHHVGIVSQTGTNTISASSIDNKVIENDWGFRDGQDIKFWRYEE